MMNEITNRFEQLIESRSWKIAKQELATLEPFQIAEIIGALSKPDRILLFRLLSRESAKETFKHLSYDEQEEIIEGLAANVDNVIGLLNDLDPDDRTAFFEELPGKVSQRLVQMLSAEEREIADDARRRWRKTLLYRGAGAGAHPPFRARFRDAQCNLCGGRQLEVGRRHPHPGNSAGFSGPDHSRLDRQSFHRAECL